MSELKELQKDIVFDSGKLETLIATPFSVIDLEKREYKDRKNLWCKFLPALENNRENIENKTHRSSTYDFDRKFKHVSVFNPFICEIVYKWFSAKDCKILDPFAGGAVRGFVASYLDRQYAGCDINKNQIVDNNNYISMLDNNKYKPVYYNCSSADFTSNEHFDLLFTCPPYFNIEKYNGGEKDLSMLPTYEVFLEQYDKCFSNCCKYMKNDTFACIVVSNFRGKNGFYHDFVGDTIKIMQKNNYFFYNDMILKTPVGSACIMANNYLKKNRKVAKIHQNLLVFYKGDIKNIHFDDISEKDLLSLPKERFDNAQNVSVFDFL